MGASGLVVVGHIAREITHSPNVTSECLGGAATYFAIGASASNGRHTGIVSNVGTDIDVSLLRSIADVSGIAIIEGCSARFVNTEDAEAVRSFQVDWGVAALPFLGFKSYSRPQQVHLGPAPPQTQRSWLRLAKEHWPNARVSIDTFEVYAAQCPEETQSILNEASIAFLNESELSSLGGLKELTSELKVVKLGSRGAELVSRDSTWATRPTHHRKLIDTTGAGDILAGYFLAELISGRSPRTALSEAVEVAADSVEFAGVPLDFAAKRREAGPEFGAERGDD